MTFKNSKRVRSFKLLKIALVVLGIFSILCPKSLGLGYFPPSRFSHQRDHSAFWSNNKREDSLSDRQKTLIKKTLKELSKAGVTKSARSKCVQDIATSLLFTKVVGSRESALLEESARCCADKGEPDLAEALTQCSLKMFKSKDEASSYSRSQSLDNLAGLQLKKGACKEAMNSLNEALEIQRRYSSRRASDTGVLLNHLAQCYAQSGLYKESIRVLKQAIENDTAVRGAESFAVAEDLFNLGVVHHLAGDNASALAAVEESLDKLPANEEFAKVRKDWTDFCETLNILPTEADSRK
jgi:tetratricopeptide (TPR) repeat protein